MTAARRIGLFIAAAGLVAAVAAQTVSAHDRTGPVVTPLAEFGSDDFVTGSTIGPGRRLAVTDGVAGAVLRIRPSLRTSGPVCRRAATEGVPG